MAEIPAEHGGNRAFIEDPATATNADTIGDLTAMMQLLMHAVEQTEAVPAALRNAVAVARPRVDAARQAAEAIALRDVNQRNPPPLTHIPEGGFGDQPFGNTRFQHIAKFEVKDDRKPPPAEVYSWLSACSVTATTARLDDNAFYTLLMSTSTHDAFRYVESCFRRGLPVRETVRCLEGRYGNLETPAEAGLSLTDYERNPKRSICATLDDLRILATLHLRTLPAAERQQRIEELVQIHLLRVLPNDIGLIIKEEIRRASLSGAKVPSVDDLANRADRLEARKTSHHDKRDKDRHHVRQTQEVYIDKPSIPMLESHVVSSREAASIKAARYLREVEAAEAAEELMNSMQPGNIHDDTEMEIVETAMAIQQVLTTRNQQTSPQNLLSAAIRQMNKRRMPVNQVSGADQVPQGPPNKMARQTTFIELLKLANVNKGECLMCGLQGHIRGNVNCALRGLPLMDIPCTRCGKGLHSADSCPKPYMNPNVVNVCEGESLNGL